MSIYIFDEYKDPFSHPFIGIFSSHQNSILYIDGTSWKCKITHLIHIACTISAIAMDYWTPKQENILPSAAFLFNKDSKSVENTCNLVRLEKS